MLDHVDNSWISIPGDRLAVMLLEEEHTCAFFLAYAKLVAHKMHLLRCDMEVTLSYFCYTD